MNKTLEILDKLEGILSPETIVTDVCSLKDFVSKKKRPYKFIPSHPMAGTENKGFENSFEGLFQNAKWVITPVFGTDDRLVNLIEELGAKVVITTPQKHDEAVALISHMPLVIAQAIFKTAQDNELALEIASSGFRDMTRLAMSNPEMANDMVQMNSKNIEESILKLYKSIGDLTNSNYLEQVNEIRQIRQSMFL
jgi:arogenate dehydrogenase (NADP+)